MPFNLDMSEAALRNVFPLRVDCWLVENLQVANSNVISSKILSSSKNCFINAPCCSALHAHIVSASLLESATSGLCPDFERKKTKCYRDAGSVLLDIIVHAFAYLWSS